MANVIRQIRYRCSDDCIPSGCPSHFGQLKYQSTADAYTFWMNGRELHFESGEMAAMIALLDSLGRADSVQVRATPTPDASGEGKS